MLRMLHQQATQDYQDGHLYYTVHLGGKKIRVRSDHTVLTTADTMGGRDTAGWSADGLRDYLTGKDVPAAAAYQTLRQHLRERVVLKPDPYYSLLALWTMGTYVHRIFRYYPYLWVQGSHPRCGKTVLLETLQPLVFQGALCVALSGRALYGLSDTAATLLIDDDVKNLHGTPFRRAVLAAGFRQGAVFPVWERAAKGYRRCRYHLYSPKALVGDGEAARYLWDKCLSMHMAPKAPGERIVRDGLDAPAAAQALRDDLHILGLNYAAEIAHRYTETTYPFGLRGVRDRELDLWQPLFGLAQIVDRELGGATVTEDLLELR